MGASEPGSLSPKLQRKHDIMFPFGKAPRDPPKRLKADCQTTYWAGYPKTAKQRPVRGHYVRDDLAITRDDTNVRPYGPSKAAKSLIRPLGSQVPYKTLKGLIRPLRGLEKSLRIP